MIAEQLDPIIKGGQRLEAHLREQLNQSVRTAIHFPDTEIVIVEAARQLRISTCRRCSAWSRSAWKS